MFIDEENYLEHYGVLRRSGRYPWGSGGPETGGNKNFIDYVDELRKHMSEVDVARALETSVASLRAARSIAKSELKQADIAMAVRLKEKQMSNTAISERMFGTPTKESTVRSLLSDSAGLKAEQLLATANMLKDQVSEKRFIDVGDGVEQHIGISATKLANAVAMLREEGYELRSVPIKTLTVGQNTTVKVLAPPGTTWGEVKKNQELIKQIVPYSEDGGSGWITTKPPLSISPERVGVLYKEDGGAKADGVIFIRPGVKDVEIGQNNYAQVRVKVGEEHYLKGMAVYKDGLPDGVDIQFNTSKSDTGNKLDSMKKFDRNIDGNIDVENPFGAKISRQIFDKNDKEVPTSVMNLVNEEGTWSSWSKTLSTQMLSKQNPTLAKAQLDMTYEQRAKEFKRISDLTNPTVRKSLLEKFGDETDSAAVQLDAAALSTKQAWHVILPVSSIPKAQIYAPNFKDGEIVVLIRYPHAGTFEIPELTVNNRNPEARRLLGSARDAVGIHHSVAERLSGADFDGDTVLVIPNSGSKKVKHTPALDDLKGFEPRVAYAKYEGMKVMTEIEKGLEMGKISNLITDMTLRRASDVELAKAVKHSMVVIDAEKHELNYKQSAIDNGIPSLKAKYQGKATGGASTLISRATAKQYVNARKPRPAAEGGPIDRETGKRVFVETGAKNYKTGKPNKTKLERLAVTDDATTLFVGTPTRMERLYADHSNKLKALANQARKESVNTPRAKYDPGARKAYAPEVNSLNSKLALAVRNRPLERQAQIVGNTLYRAKLDANPEMDKATRKKVKAQIQTEARRRTGAQKQDIKITPDEWNAIQAGAISDDRMRQILAKADIDVVRKLATPRPTLLMTPTMNTRAIQMLNSGYTRAQVAEQLGVSITTLDTATNE